MLLIPSKMYEMDLEPPPVSNDPKEWQAWSRLLVPRLELADDGLLQVSKVVFWWLSTIALRDEAASGVGGLATRSHVWPGHSRGASKVLSST